MSIVEKIESLDRKNLLKEKKIVSLDDFFDWLILLINNKLERFEVPEKVDPGYVINKNEIKKLLFDDGPSNLNNKFLKKDYIDIEEEFNVLFNSILDSNNSRIGKIIESFLMNEQSFKIFIICLAPYVNIKFEKIYAYLQNDSNKKYPTISLVYSLLKSDLNGKYSVNNCLSDSGFLFLWNILSFNRINNDKENFSMADQVNIDKRIINYLFDYDVFDKSLMNFLKIISTVNVKENLFISKDIKKHISCVCKQVISQNYYILLKGPAGKNKLETAMVIAGTAGHSILSVDCTCFINGDKSYDEMIIFFTRESLLGGYALYFENFDLINNESRFNIIKKISEYLLNSNINCFIDSSHKNSSFENILKIPLIEINMDSPDYDTRMEIWNYYLADLNHNIDINKLAGLFKLTEEQIYRSVELAKVNQFENTLENTLYNICKLQNSEKIASLTKKINHDFKLKDIILPEVSLEQLNGIIEYSKYQNLVFEKWGFQKKLPYGKGLSIMFAGPSGTGKTMAAGIIANELKLDAYRIDLSSVVSKYIGETEKNLSKIFEAASCTNAILFFDEADAIFGKRTDVKDAHDRYANIEVSYLLQMMEEYDGITILTTNYRDNVDAAFTRRLKFIVEFPTPGIEERKKLWEAVFPTEAPIDENIDFAFLANKIKATGGDIKLIALMSAMLAASENSAIKMKHIIKAVKNEYLRTGKSFLEYDFKPYYSLLKE